MRRLPWYSEERITEEIAAKVWEGIGALRASRAAASSLRGAPKLELDGSTLHCSESREAVQRPRPLAASELTRRRLEAEHTVRGEGG